ncbi:e3 ubiquitin-protein ligase uhrf-related [Holotrichia oblita]|uniref:E3 ubiquitin-protein ligase uhrf-related n=1 Tax=Holotrichia oblita TaxID=644536 RepID=A0ACB9SXX4_HOLOL|nr:e3 ubiquitin-protein ligase uhrf-related [Holotrichia oblita]
MLAPNLFSWPTAERIHKTQNLFQQLANVTNVVGAVDGTFVPIKTPKNDPEVCKTRKCNYAITLQATCDPKLKIIYCFVGYPGSVSDTRIFRNSDLYLNVNNNYQRYFPNDESFIIGDRAYPLLQWCIPPYIDRGNLTPSRRFFNTKISQTRQVIERTFALLIGRFRRLKFLDMNKTEMIAAVQYITEGQANVIENEGHDPNVHVEDIDIMVRDGHQKREHLCQYLYDNQSNYYYILGGKPVRVVRNFKLGKHSKYAPKDGNRYDGIYKVVKYYPEKGKSGFTVWRYLLRRDDPTPAPWQKDHEESEIIYPPGYLEAQASKEKTREKGKVKKSPTNTKRGAKRAPSEQSSNQLLGMFKKMKTDSYKLESELSEKIDNDKINQHLWNECKEFLKLGKSKFVSKVEESFNCICCQELVHMPITTICKHNICKSCLGRSFSADIFTCPYCRFELGKDYKITVNENLATVLQKLFPGYEVSR